MRYRNTDIEYLTDEILRLAEQGWILTTISKYVDMSAAFVCTRLRSHGVKAQKRPRWSKKGYESRGCAPKVRSLCACGCGGLTAKGSKFILGHNSLGTSRSKESIAKTALAQPKQRHLLHCSWCFDVIGRLDWELKAKSGGKKEHVYCSRECVGRHQSVVRVGENAARWSGGKVPIKCEQCGGYFDTYPGNLQKQKNLFCSQGCLAEWKRAHVWGPFHPQWQGGLSFQEYCAVWKDKEFKQDIRDRDTNTCMSEFCAGADTRICIHHINYDKQDCRPINLVTLCSSCNSRANYMRPFWQEYFTDLNAKRLNEGATTIPQGSRPQAIGGRSAGHLDMNTCLGDDIVSSAWRHAAA